MTGSMTHFGRTNSLGHIFAPHQEFLGSGGPLKFDTYFIGQMDDGSSRRRQI